MSQPAVSVSELTKIFPVTKHLRLRRKGEKRFVVAVDNLNLEVKEGEVYGLIGPNGSGKSTTMKVVLGLVRPTKGKAEVFGVDSHKVEARTSIGFVPENPYFYKHLSGEETLRFYGRLSGVTAKGLHQKIPKLLKLVGLEKAADRRLGGYSKGMLQRIGLAQALVQDPATYRA